MTDEELMEEVRRRRATAPITMTDEKKIGDILRRRLGATARDEAGEERDVVIGDVVVGDAAIGAVADVLGAKEIVLAQLHVRAVGNGRAATAPVRGQGEPGVLVDNVDHRCLQLVGADVLRVDPAQRLRRGDIGSMPSGLAWAKIAAVAEHGEQVALLVGEITKRARAAQLPAL